MNPSRPRPGLATAAWLWLLVFLAVVLTRGMVRPPHPAVLPALTVTGWALAAGSMRERLVQLLREHKAIWVTLAVFIAAITVSELLAHSRGVAGLAPFLPDPAWLVLCLAPASVILMDPAKMRLAVVLLAAISVWHFFTMPLEALDGVRRSWQPMPLFPREAGPLQFQASGLAWQVYYFVGFFLPAFYLAWGPMSEGRVTQWPRLPAWGWALLAMAWGVPAVCAQSRSAFAGTMAAGLLALAAWRRPRHAGAWLAIGALVAIGVAAYWYLFSTNKSGLDLRLAYYELYLQESLKWPALLVGHGFTLVPNEAMFVKGLTPLEHSHNDIIQTLYSWGAVALVAYLAFLVALVRFIFKAFVLRGRSWPLCALLVFIPNTVTDIGFQALEKAAFLVLLVSWCFVFERPEFTPATVEPAA